MTTTRKPKSYAVLRALGEGKLEVVQSDVTATSRKAAIKAATDDEGTFVVMPTAEFVALTRKRETSIVDHIE